MMFRGRWRVQLFRGDKMGNSTRIKLGISAFLIALTIVFVGGAGQAFARTQIGDFEISGEIFHLSELRFDGTPSDTKEFDLFVAPGVSLGPAALGAPSNQENFETLNAFRTELNLETVYKGIDHITPVLKLRMYYDGAFDINDKSNTISEPWKTNLQNGQHDEWDPVIREAYIDFNYHPVWVRAGRQIVTWGRSDGVTVLDVVTPRNFRNPLTFEQERFMIPQDMINLKWDLTRSWVPGGISKELQVIWNLDWTPSRFPGFYQRQEGQHPYTLNVVEFANQVINVSEGLFGENDFFAHSDWDKGDVWDKQEVFVRWRARTGSGLGPFCDLTYSIHYAHLFDDIPIYELGGRINAGFAYQIAGPRAAGGGIDFSRHRYDLAGFSFDKALMWLPGALEGTVLRGEVVYNMGKRFYEPDLETHKADQVTALIGLDQYLYVGPRDITPTPWFVSFQYWRDNILRTAGPGRFTDLGSAACAAQPRCGERGYLIGGASNAFDGQRGQKRDVVTLFMFNDFLPGKTLRVELFGLHEFQERQESTWVRGVLGYNWNNRLNTRIGVNYIWGKNDAFFGQFEKNRNVFMEVKYTF